MMRPPVSGRQSRGSAVGATTALPSRVSISFDTSAPSSSSTPTPTARGAGLRLSGGGTGDRGSAYSGSGSASGGRSGAAAAAAAHAQPTRHHASRSPTAVPYPLAEPPSDARRMRSPLADAPPPARAPPDADAASGTLTASARQPLTDRSPSLRAMAEPAAPYAWLLIVNEAGMPVLNLRHGVLAAADAPRVPLATQVRACGRGGSRNCMELLSRCAARAARCHGGVHLICLSPANAN